MSYHHGDLRRSLIDATEALLDERGAEGFSLREVARRAGVSAAAPAHHFGDSAGLLTAVVTEAFDELCRSLREGDTRGGASGAQRIIEQGAELIGAKGTTVTHRADPSGGTLFEVHWQE